MEEISLVGQNMLSFRQTLANSNDNNDKLFFKIGVIKLVKKTN